jgi:hypothetical protein
MPFSQPRKILSINATKSYNELLRLCRKELEARSIPKEQIDSINVLDQQQSNE